MDTENNGQVMKFWGKELTIQPSKPGLTSAILSAESWKERTTERCATTWVIPSMFEECGIEHGHSGLHELVITKQSYTTKYG